MQKINLFKMTRPEVEPAIDSGVDTVIVPLGSTEQHGLHLPLGTDAILGDPCDASAANGEAYMDALIDLLVRFIKNQKQIPNAVL
jgi:creatinine amidohydrolase